MHKKLMLACMAIAAFAAFVVAPAASASPVLTDPTIEGANKAVPVGTSITGANTGPTFFKGGFEVECTNDDLVGTLKENTGTKIKGEIPVGGASFKGTEAGEDCKSFLGATNVKVNSKLCLETVAGTDNVTTTGCGANVTFTLEITGTGPCKYSAASISGTYNTNADATVNIPKGIAKKEEGGIFCPGEGFLEMDFDLYTTGKGTLSIS
ncbi:MAG: hypothetical protein ACTHLH_01575 [Solirubrobacterales bacterium]